MLSGRKLEFWEIPSEFSQMDPSSLLKSYRKTEGFLGLNCLVGKNPGGGSAVGLRGGREILETMFQSISGMDSVISTGL